MNHCERALAAMQGKAVDQIPFIGRMDLWYSYHRSRGTLPHPYENADLWDIQRDLGIGIFGFGVWDISFYKLHYQNITVDKSCRGNLSITTYQTPFGRLQCGDVMSDELKEAAGTGARVEYPFKGEQDYDALQYLIEHTHILENFKEYGRFVDSIGGDGIALPFSGHLPAHQLMLHLMGYQTFYYELNDNPNKVNRLIEALTEKQHAILDFAALCPAQAIEVGGNYDEHVTPPPVFRRFFAPFYQDARKKLASGGKVMVVHGDGEMQELLRELRDCGVDVVEALTPQPMTSIDIGTVRKLWNGKVAIWGALPTVILTQAFSDEDFEKYLFDLLEAIAPGDRFILGFGDNVPTDAVFTRIKRVAEFWHEHNAYPIQSHRNGRIIRDLLLLI